VTPPSPLLGKRVLITRPAHQAEELARTLREAGAEPIVAPTIAIGPPDDPRPAREAVERLPQYEWLVFTSRNAVDAFDALLRARANVPAGVRIAAIGPATAAALRACGLGVDAMPASFVSEALADELLARTAPGARILLFRAQEARETVPETLRAQGRIVDAVAAYATRPLDDPSLGASTARADIVTFASASAVDGFVRNVPNAASALAAKTVAAIGPITAQAARDAGLRVDVVAASFTVEALLQALDSAALA
jgi:uroporphyrinogen-III synthase